LDASLAGTLAGLLHVVSGPDHLIAVAPLAIRRPISGLRVGLSWGFGHASGVLLVGTLGVVFRSFVQVRVLSEFAEGFVGLVLIGVGIWAISQMRKVIVHQHPHQHAHSAPVDMKGNAAFPSSRDARGEQGSHLAARHDTHPHSQPASIPHAHLHVHTRGGATAESKRLGGLARHGTFYVGLVHGAAGTGHLLGVLPSLALPPAEGAVYLVSYGVAAVVAMGGFGFTIGMIGSRLSPAWLRTFMLASGLTAVGIGLYWLQRGFLDHRG